MLSTPTARTRKGMTSAIMSEVLTPHALHPRGIQRIDTHATAVSFFLWPL